jgi:hypothetical protein
MRAAALADHPTAVAERDAIVNELTTMAGTMTVTLSSQTLSL